MRLMLTLVIAFAFATHFHVADTNAQEDADSARIKDLIAELTKKAAESRVQLEELHSRYGAKHPRVRNIELQLKEIADAKTELASKLAMIQLSDAHKELKKHAGILSKHLSVVKEMMKAKVDDAFKSEYQKIHEHSHKIIQMIQEHVNKKHKDVANELKDIFSESNIDPEKIIKSYDRAIFESLSNAIAKRRDQALVELEKAKAAQEKSTLVNQDLQQRIRQLEARLAKERAVADEHMQMIEIEKRKADETKSAFEDALRIADLKLRKFAIDKEKMDQAIDTAKSLRSTSKDQQVKKLNDLYMQLSKVKNDSDKATQSVASRLKKVEADVGQIKSLLQELVEKLK